MSRRDRERLDDIILAAGVITTYLDGGGRHDGLVFDAVRMRLVEIGEAVKALDPVLLADEPDIPWGDVAGMRDHLAHRYFDAAHSIIEATVLHDLPPLVAAANRLRSSLDDSR